MPGLNTRSFFARWHALHAASNPGLRKDRWEVDGVEWTKERHSFWGERYSFQFEVHRMAHRYGSRHGWALLVVIERWWGPNRKASLREAYWCRRVAGTAESISAWLRKQQTGG
jgi:hypothetical protein